MAGKNKGGRETRKPKQDKNKKASGQTPAPRSSAVDVINHKATPHNAWLPNSVTCTGASPSMRQGRSLLAGRGWWIVGLFRVGALIWGEWFATAALCRACE
jgi:hypothetical protein